MIFGKLSMTYTQMMLSPDGDVDCCNAIIASLEKCWMNSDQAPFIASIFLNPLLKGTPFHPHSSFTLINIHHLLASLFAWFFPTEPTCSLFAPLAEYLEGSGDFAGMEDIIQRAKKAPEVRIYFIYVYLTDIWTG